MDERRRLHLFVEDIGHERLISALLKRLALEEGVSVYITTGSAQGGHPRALAELKAHQRAIVVDGGAPDLLVVAIDANCEGWAKARASILKSVEVTAFPAHALAVPDPHVERWYLSDPAALKAVADAKVNLTRRKCDRDEYKRTLTGALRRAGHLVTMGGAEFAAEIAEEMDLFQAGKNEPSLKHFLDDVRSVFKSWKG